MQIVDGIAAIAEPFPKAVVTAGNFDGVHIGHQALMRSVIEKARERGGTAVTVTFDPHPIRVLNPAQRLPLITLFDQKAELLADLGLDVLVRIPFDEEVAAISATDFLEEILVAKIGMQALVVGRDYAFGRNREGNIAFLEARAGALGYTVHTEDWIKGAGGREGRVSSTLIRERVMAGDVAEAARMLSRHYQVRGRVVAGRNRGGRLLGFPTANIVLQDELSPKSGVYAVTALHRGRIYPGVANIGFSPTFDDHIFTVEVHLLDFDKTIYDEELRVNFVQRLREEQKFNSLPELASQIQRDIKAARAMLADDAAFPTTREKS